jgi:cellulose synthase operon protein C
MSTKALVFSSEEALLAALTSELVPARMQTQAARHWTGEGGAIFVRPDKAPGKKVLRDLQSAGVAWIAAGPGRGHRARVARAWPEIIAPRPAAERSALQGQTVLFYMESAAPGSSAVPGDAIPPPDVTPPPDAAAPGTARTLIDLAAELLRLSCDRCSYQLLEREGAHIALLRAFDPPYYTLAACGDRDAAYRAFVPIKSGQTRTWIELGYAHPLGQAFEPPEGHIGLIMREGAWLDLPDGPWRDMFELIELTLPAGAHAHAHAPPPKKREVPLRLAPATRAESPSLWVLEHRALDQVDSLVSTVPDSIIGRLLFAVLDAGADPLVVLRARLGREGPPQLDVAGIAMVPLLSIANLYVPHDAMVEPPLRRDTLRALLAPDDDRLYWLAPTGDRNFRVESAPERAFSPLADWVEYLVHTSADALAPWVRSITFEFQSFQSIGAEWAQAAQPQPERAGDQDEHRPGRHHRRPRQPGGAQLPGDLQAEAEALDSQDDQDGEPAASAAKDRHHVSNIERELNALERAFLDSDAPADHSSRTEMWLSMARLLGRGGRHKDASLCFVRVVWELPRDDCRELMAEWARAEAAAVAETDPASLLWYPLRPQDEPDLDQVRAVAVHWIATTLAGLEAAPAPAGAEALAHGSGRRLIQQWFDRHDDALDVRTVWLLRWALAEHAGGDPLGLARTRDRLLQRLQNGLSLSRDVPTFLRFLGHRGGGDSAAVAQLVSSLESLVGLFDRTRRQRSANEAPATLTRAYVNLVIAYGFARLGQAERAAALRDQAARALDLGDPVHGFLVRAYSARIAQALDGLPPETPLPAEITAMLGELNDGLGDSSLVRYKVDRLRQASTILEPHERIDAIHGFLRRRSQPDEGELAGLRGASPSELSSAVARILALAMNPATPPDQRARLFDGLMDLFPMLPDSQAVPALRRILAAVGDIAPAPRALLLEEALMLAGYFGRDALAGEIARSIAALVAELSSSEAESLAPEFGACLRSLRRVGLRDQAAALIDALSAKVTGEGVPAALARLHLAAGLAHLGHFEQAAPILARARDILASAEGKIVDQRLRLVQALAQALAECPQDRAVEGLSALSEELARITDHYNTNTHFCLSVIVFMEALVLGYAKSELALGELGRRWLEEDEHLVRRRIHRELGERP